MARDSDSSEEKLLPLALPVAPIPEDFDPTRTPTSAEEYLQQVVWEARHCDDVVTVKIAPEKLKRNACIVKKLEKAHSPQGFTPTLETQQEILVSFSKVRSHIASLRASGKIPEPPFYLPSPKKKEAWCRLCFGNSFQLSLLQKSGQETASPPLVQGKEPLLSILLNLNQSGLESLLESHAQWLEVLGFSAPQGRWFFAILACLEKPLTPEGCSLIRQVARLCAKSRSELSSVDDPHLPQLNIIICIAARYFSQEDLADK